MIDKNALISDIHELKDAKKHLEEAVTILKTSISSIDDKINAKEAALLEYMKLNNQLLDTDVPNLVAAVFRKESVGYTSESDVLAYLKANNRDDLIKIKTTESLDKTAIKKALKSDSTLAENLDSMTTRLITEYVVVTTADNYNKMVEHINEGSNK